MTFRIEIHLSDDMDFCSLKHTPEGWEATLRTKPVSDKFGDEIPHQIGFGFKGRDYQSALRSAEVDARSKLSRIKGMRNSKPKKQMSEEETLLNDLGLL